MILKSFYRKKSTKIYIIIMITIFSTLIAMNVINDYLKNVKYENFLERLYILLESDKDYYELLNKSQYFININEILLGEYNGNIIDGRYVNQNSLNNRALIYSDSSIAENEIVIGLEDYVYLFNSGNINSAKYDIVELKIQNEIFNLKIKDIYKSGKRSEIKISNTLYKSLCERNDSIIYIFNVKNENEIDKAWQYLVDNIDGEIISLNYETPADVETRKELEEYTFFLEISIYVFIGIFLIILLIINKNILADLNKNIYLEYCLGFKNKIIKFNVLSRLMSIHIVSFIISIAICLSLIEIINLFKNLNLQLNFNLLLLELFTFILIIDFFLSLFISIKLNKLGRR